MQPAFELASLRALRIGCDRSVPPGFDAWFRRCVAQQGRFADAEQASAALPSATPSAVGALTVPATRTVAPRRSWNGFPLLGAVGAAAVVAGIAIVNSRNSTPAPELATSVIASAAAAMPLVPPVSTTSSFTPPIPDAPGCSADCSAGCKHLLLAAGPAFEFYERLALRQREEMGLCSEITRLSRRAATPADQFSYSLWVPSDWAPPAGWVRPEPGVAQIPETNLVVRDDYLRVSKLKGEPLFPPPCVRASLSFTNAGRAYTGNDAFERCALRPASESIEKEGTWTWKATNGGLCSCVADDTAARRLRELGSCLMTCRADAACVDACEAHTLGP